MYVLCKKPHELGDPAPLTRRQLQLIRGLSETRLDCEFWAPINQMHTIKLLLGHIKYLEDSNGSNRPGRDN